MKLTFFVFAYFIASPFLIAQIDPPEIDSLSCDVYMEQMSCVLAWDTLGVRGVKLLATETILAHNCDFVGRPISDVVQYYGVPDKEFEWFPPWRKKETVYSYEYKLYTHKIGDKYTYGDKWLVVTTDEKRIITKFLMYTVDE